VKFRRQAKILELIEREKIETQEDLSSKLREVGYHITQATISRDIKELRLVKTLTADGTYKYSASIPESAENNFVSRLRNIFKECVTSIDFAQNIVVIKTLPALGSAAASAIDSMRVAEIVGTLAGDDTVFVVMRTAASAEIFCADAHTLLR